MDPVSECREINTHHEFDSLDKKLHEFADNFINTTSERWGKIFLLAKTNHDSKINGGKEKCQQMRSMLEKNSKESQEKERVLEERNSNLQELKSVCREINSEADDIIHKKELMEKDLKKVMDRITQEKDYMSKQDQNISTKMVEYEKVKSYFNERLGLQFKKTMNNRIQIIFKYINYRKPNHIYVFFIKVNDDGVYQVSDCQPLISNLEDLVKELNAKNNLSNFILSMRKAFKALAINK